MNRTNPIIGRAVNCDKLLKEENHMRARPVDASSQVPNELQKQKSLAAKTRLAKELNPKNKADYAVGIEPGTYRLVVNASTQKLYDKLLKKFPDLKFEGIEIVAKVVSNIKTQDLSPSKNIKIVLAAYTPFSVEQIETLKRMGLKTDNEAGQIRILGEVDDPLVKEKISKLDFIKHAEDVIYFYPCSK